METNKTYHIALLLEAEPVLVALSYGKQTRVERLEGMDHLSAYKAVLELEAQGVRAVAADRDVHSWASMIWRERQYPNHGTIR